MKKIDQNNFIQNCLYCSIHASLYGRSNQASNGILKLHIVGPGLFSLHAFVVAISQPLFCSKLLRLSEPSTITAVTIFCDLVGITVFREPPWWNLQHWLSAQDPLGCEHGFFALCVSFVQVHCVAWGYLGAYLFQLLCLSCLSYSAQAVPSLALTVRLHLSPLCHNFQLCWDWLWLSFKMSWIKNSSEH